MNTLKAGVLNLISAAVGPAAVVVTRVHAPGPEEELFIGRDRQTEALLATLAPAAKGSGAVMVCAVAGMGGIGKTALARHAAELAVSYGWFAGGAVWVDLHGYEPDHATGGPVQPGQVFAPLLRALGIPGQDMPPTVSEQATVYHQLLDTLAEAGQRVLVVLDNAADTGQVGDLLPRAAGHRVVITSRDTLPVPRAARLDLDVLTEPEAKQLLRDTLTRRDPTDTRADEDPGVVGQVIEWCGRLPLAVAIAAGVLADDLDLSIAELAAELAGESTRLAALDDGTGGVHAAFMASWRRLRARNPQAAWVLCLLTVAPGPEVSTEAVAVIAGQESAAAVRGWLRLLHRSHLLIGQRGRWRFHDLIRMDTRQHAIPDLGLAPEEPAAATDRLLDHYLMTTHTADRHLRALMGQAVPELLGGQELFGDQEQALAWLDAEQANLTAAVRLATDTQRDRTAVRLALSLAVFLTWRRQFSDWVVVAQDAYRAACHLGDPSTQARTLNNLGMALREVRRFDEAGSALAQAADIFREIGDHRREGQALNNLGMALHGVGRFEEAISAHTWAADIFRVTGGPGEGLALNNLGNALREVGRFEEAISAHTWAAGIFREISDRHGEGLALNNLGNALQGVGRFDEAISAHSVAADIFRETGDRHGEGTALGNLGNALREVQRFDEARQAWDQAVRTLVDSGDLDSAAVVRSALDDLGDAE